MANSRQCSREKTCVFQPQPWPARETQCCSLPACPRLGSASCFHVCAMKALMDLFSPHSACSVGPHNSTSQDRHVHPHELYRVCSFVCCSLVDEGATEWLSGHVRVQQWKRHCWIANSISHIGPWPVDTFMTDANCSNYRYVGVTVPPRNTT